MSEYQIVSQQQRTERDASVGDIERWPVILSGVQQNEINHKPEPHTISQVAQDARQQQRGCSENAIVVSRRAKKVKQHRNGRDCRQDDEKPAAKRAAFLQLPKGDAAILGINKIEQAANDRRVLKAQPS